MSTFRAVYAEQKPDKSYDVRLAELPRERLALSDGEVLVDVAYSSLNYKDGLAVTGRGKIIRKFPMILGIDLAGTVLESKSPHYKAGEAVLAVGQGLGELAFGGFSTLERVNADALVRIPSPLDPKRAMAIGTAGFTAMLAVMALEQAGVKPGEREVLVTGAAGGVGSLSVKLLAALGHRVAASTGRPETHPFLRELGARTLVDRAVLAQKGPALASERWTGAVDTVGGQTLATVLAQTAAYGAVAACGMAGGSELATSVFPFILRNVSLLGVNSTLTPLALREEAWKRLAALLDAATLDRLSTTEPMSRIVELSEEILAGRVRGRVVVDVKR